MSPKLLLLLACLPFSIGGVNGADIPAHPPSNRKLSLIGRPITFEPNRGQIESTARFLTRGAGYSARLSPARTEFQFGARTVSMDLLGANADAAIQGTSPLPGTVNYFAGSDSAKWHANIPTYSRVNENGVYPGVDLTFYGNQNRLEYDFKIQPGADPRPIKLKLSGFDKIRLGDNGDLILNLGREEFRLLKPLAYQQANNGRSRQTVEADYRLTASLGSDAATVQFRLGKHDSSVPLVIDPVMTYSATLDSYANAVAADASGNTYTVSGYEFTTPMYVTKFGPTGSVIYDTVIGTGGLLGVGIALDSAGKAYITGTAGSASGLPTNSHSYQAAPPPGPIDAAFLVVLSANGASVPYATYLAGSFGSSATAVAVDQSGFPFIAGVSEGSDFPTTPGVYHDPRGVGQAPGFVAKFNSSASGSASLLYSVLIGPPNGYNRIMAMAADQLGNAYVTGVMPPGYPVTTGAFNYTGYASASGGVYVTKLNPAATSLLYSAYLGDGVGYSIAVDKQYNAYVTGTVAFADFPTTAGAYQTSYPGGFVTKLNPSGSAEVFSTFLGGPSSYLGNVTPLSVAITPGCPAASPSAIPCNVYVGGWTGADDYPTVNPIQEYLSKSSAFITELTPDGTSALFSTYLSGAGTGIQLDLLDSTGTNPLLAVDGTGNISMVANTPAGSGFPISTSSARTGSGVLIKISPATSAALFASPASVNFGTQPVGLSSHQYGGTATVRVMNLSNVAVPVSGIQVTPASFTQTNNCGTSIAAGGSCSFNVDFAPAAAGAFSGKITIASGELGSPKSISLSGTAQDEGVLEASVSSLVFAAQTVEQSSSAQTLTVTNVGTQPSALSVSLPTTSFSELNNCPAILAARASCLVSVTFNPSQPGLQTASLVIKSAAGSSPVVSLTGTAETPNAAESVTLTATALTFSPQTVGTAAVNADAVSIINTGTDPVTLNSITASGDFSVGFSQCQYPFQLNPQQSCSVALNFAPTVSGTRTGTLSFSDSASAAPQTVSLAGTGMASSENLEFYPSAALIFPDQVVNTVGGAQTINLINTGSAPLAVDRVLAAGDFKITADSCSGREVSGTTQDGIVNFNTCQVKVAFTPAAAGSRTGTVTFIDSSAGSPHVVHLTGNGVAATGALALDVTSLNFATQAVGTTGAAQVVTLENPGNTPLAVTSVSTDNADFTVTAKSCTLPAFTIAPLSSCTVEAAFSPAQTGSRSGKLNIVSAAGTTSAQLRGTAVTETQTLQFTPSNSMNFGQEPQTIFVQNTGSAAVSFYGAPVISGANATDFTIVANTCTSSLLTILPVNASCSVTLEFIPSVVTQETASIAFNDSASGLVQRITLNGLKAVPSVIPAVQTLTFAPQVEGTTSNPAAKLFLINYSNSSVTLGSAAVTGNFLLTHGGDSCSGQTIASDSSCSVEVQFAPPLTTPAANAYSSGTLLFVNSTQTVVATVSLFGYGLAPTVGAYLTPASVAFDTPQVLTTTSSSYVSLTLNNTGNTPLSVGSAAGKNLGIKGPTAEFGFISDECAGQTIQPGSSCPVYLDFTPYTAGTRTGTISYQVTYANKTTATLSASLQGQGIAEKNSAFLTPAAGSFADQTLSVTNPSKISAYLTNDGNQPLKVGTLTGVNAVVGATVTGDFSTAAASGGSDACSQATVQPGATCLVVVAFTPSAAGQRTGSISFPVVYNDKTTASLTLTLTGKGVAQVKTIQISTGSSLYFGEVSQGGFSNPTPVAVTNTGNTPVSIGHSVISSGNSDFSIQVDGCSSASLPAGQTCYFELMFTPAAASPAGTRKGTLTLADNAAGGPHQVMLSGVSIPKQQQLAFSAASLSFGNQPVNTTSSTQAIYVSNQGSSPVSITGFVLSGVNAHDYQVNPSCLTVILPQMSCTLQVSFTPGALGTRNAAITETDTSSPKGQLITLTGIGSPALPHVSFLPGTLAFPLQDVGTVSAGKTFSITNTGSASLKITNVASTNASEFALTSDSCVGATLAPGLQCLATVTFSPKLGGTRSGGIQVSSNASAATLPVSGLALGIPKAVPGVSSVSFGSQNTGSTSSAQNITLTNTGTDTLAITSIAISGTDAADYAISIRSCANTLAPSTACAVDVTFTPSAAGTRTATLTFTDNAANTPGSKQTVSLTGTGVSAPQAAVSPTSLTFAVTTIGSASAAQTVTVSNKGASALAIASIKLTGTNPGDFATTTACGSTLAAAASCAVSVTFKPTAAGTRAATLAITDNANNVTGSIQTIALTGTGEVVPKATLSQASLAFPATKTGTASAAKTVILSNPGMAPLNVTSIVSAGTDAADFTVTNNCVGVVAAGGSCTIYVIFNPAAAGSRSATLTVTDNANYATGSQQTVALSGTGTS